MPPTGMNSSGRLFGMTWILSGSTPIFPYPMRNHRSVEQLRTGWQRWKPTIAALAKAKNMPVLFTEFGYRSMDFTAKKPWLVDRDVDNVNLEAQVNATKAIMDEFWNEEWFAGGYVWKWFIEHQRAGGANDNQFTPQNKPAEAVIGQYYKRNR